MQVGIFSSAHDPSSCAKLVRETLHRKNERVVLDLNVSHGSKSTHIKNIFYSQDRLASNGTCVHHSQATPGCPVRAVSQAIGASTTPSSGESVGSATVMATWTLVTLTLGPVG